LKKISFIILKYTGPSPGLAKKNGFETLERRILQSNREKMDEWLENLKAIRFVDGGKCRLEIEEVLSGRKPFSFMPWRVINYCRWLS